MVPGHPGLSSGLFSDLNEKLLQRRHPVLGDPDDEGLVRLSSRRLPAVLPAENGSPFFACLESGRAADLKAKLSSCLGTSLSADLGRKL